MANVSKFKEITEINVNDKKETKKTGSTELSYLSWAYAWVEFKKAYPDAQYTIQKYENEKGCLVPYMYDEETGYMVSTTVTAEGLTYEMWLPVMDSNNRAMRQIEQKFTTKLGKEINVPKATMFDINKTIMRCLVKNLAMFGLGIYIYAGEDLPEDMMSEKEKTEKTTDILSKIKTGSKEEVKLLYQQNKKQIAANKDLMDAITKRTKELKGIA